LDESDASCLPLGVIRNSILDNFSIAFSRLYRSVVCYLSSLYVACSILFV